MTGAALRFAPPIRCHRELGPGEVKRIASGRVLVGYYLRCPGCNAVLQGAADDFVETLPLVEQPAEPNKVSARTMRPTALVTRAPVTCRSCGGAAVICDDRVELGP